MRSALPLLGLTLTLVGCERTEKDSNTFIPNAIDDSGTGGTTDDTGTGGTTDGDFLEPVAVGFEYVGAWDQEVGVLEDDYLYPDLEDTNGGPFALLSTVNVSLATSAYFGMESDDPAIDAEHCDFLAFFVSTPGPLDVEEFNWDAGVGGTGVPLETWGTFEGYLVILEDTLDDTCYDLDPSVFPGGDPIETFDNMHFGMGFGPLSIYNEQRLAEAYAEEWPDYQDAFMSQYIAINHPDGAGGYTFTAYDWNTALLVETDYNECQTVDGTSTSFDVCGMVQIEEQDGGYVYVLGDVTDQPIHAYMNGSAYWYEDFPNLDLSLLKEGVPQ